MGMFDSGPSMPAPIMVPPTPEPVPVPVETIPTKAAEIKATPVDPAVLEARRREKEKATMASSASRLLAPDKAKGGLGVSGAATFTEKKGLFGI